MKILSTPNVVYYKYKAEPCEKCGVVGPHYCPPTNNCMFDGLDPNTVYGLSCLCAKCSPQCGIDTYV